MSDLDPRRHPIRPDLAAVGYEDRVDAPRFVEGHAMRIGAASMPLRRSPGSDQPIDTEVLFGESFTVYERREDGWCWGQLQTDGYVGWLPASALSESTPAATHRVAALRTYRYPQAELKMPPVDLLSMGSLVSVDGCTVTRDLRYALLSDGTAVVAGHIVPLEEQEADWVAVAERFAGTPYLWAGRTSVGIDCSALIQLSCQAAGIAAPRDSYMQEAELGTALDIDAFRADPRRGDLVFWRGHVGVMTDPQTFLHANGFTMTVSSEPLASVEKRLNSADLPITMIRRI